MKKITNQTLISFFWATLFCGIVMGFVITTIAINYKIIPESVPEIYKTLGVNYAETIIYPMEQETNKAITAKFTAEELITKRNDVREAMKTELAEKLRTRNIIVEEISIVNFEFSPSFSQAIEAKVTAEQTALKEQNNLKVIEFLAQQKVAEAKGQAEAIQIIEEQLSKSTTYIEWMKVNKWDGHLPSVTSGMLFIDVTSKVEG